LGGNCCLFINRGVELSATPHKYEEPTITAKKTRVNEEITAPIVFLIGGDDSKIGETNIKEALEKAKNANSDLVEIAPQASPPVCRIMDYGKYRFEQNKKFTQQKKKQKLVQLKEIKLRPVTDEGDLQIKLRAAMRFIEDGDKVKFTVRFRGREIAYQNQGVELLNRIEQDFGDTITVEQRPKSEGKQITMVISPKKK
jgi:translation initiation factor IF-3